MGRDFAFRPWQQVPQAEAEACRASRRRCDRPYLLESCLRVLSLSCWCARAHAPHFTMNTEVWGTNTNTNVHGYEPHHFYIVMRYLEVKYSSTVPGHRPRRAECEGVPIPYPPSACLRPPSCSNSTPQISSAAAGAAATMLCCGRAAAASWLSGRAPGWSPERPPGRLQAPRM